MEFQLPDFMPAAAELFVAAASLLILAVCAFCKDERGKRWAYYLTQATLLGAVWITIKFLGATNTTFMGMYVDDLLGDILKAGVYLSVFVALIYGRNYMAVRHIDKPEFYLLVLFSVLGMMVLITANNLMTVYLGLELQALSSYAMVAIDRDSPRSTEASMKYFVLGALASGLLLYGMSMVYGATGTLDITNLARALYEDTANTQVLAFGLVFVVAGIAFKFGAVPFHMWLPDVYHGAPTAVTLLISSAPKLAAFAMAFRLLAQGMWDMAEQWQHMLTFLAVASIGLGNLAAIAQTNLKRMLAFSGISHMGFILLALLSGVIDGNRQLVNNAYSAALFYAVVYVIMTLASFGMLILLSRAGFEAERMEDFKGLNQRSSWWAGMMAIVMFSMAGLPFFVGFFAKLSVLQSVVQAGHLYIAIFAVIMSLIGAFYYLRVVKVMYFDDAADYSPIHAPFSMRLLLSLNAVAIAVLGLAPDLLLQFCMGVMSRTI